MYVHLSLFVLLIILSKPIPILNFFSYKSIRNHHANFAKDPINRIRCVTFSLQRTTEQEKKCTEIFVQLVCLRNETCSTSAYLRQSLKKPRLVQFGSDFFWFLICVVGFHCQCLGDKKQNSHLILCKYSGQMFTIFLVRVLRQKKPEKISGKNSESKFDNSFK